MRLFEDMRTDMEVPVAFYADRPGWVEVLFEDSESYCVSFWDQAEQRASRSCACRHASVLHTRTVVEWELEQMPTCVLCRSLHIDICSDMISRKTCCS